METRRSFLTLIFGALFVRPLRKAFPNLFPAPPPDFAKYLSPRMPWTLTIRPAQGPDINLLIARHGGPQRMDLLCDGEEAATAPQVSPRPVALLVPAARDILNPSCTRPLRWF